MGSAILQTSCSAEIDALVRCREGQAPGACGEYGTVEAGYCQSVQECGVAYAILECVAQPNTQYPLCTCWKSGNLWFEFSVDLPVEKACFAADLLQACRY